MPRVFYAGDSQAVKINAKNLVSKGTFAINHQDIKNIPGAIKISQLAREYQTRSRRILI